MKLSRLVLFIVVFLSSACSSPSVEAVPDVIERDQAFSTLESDDSSGEGQSEMVERWISDGVILQPEDLGVEAGLPIADASGVITTDGQVRLYVFAQEQGVRSLISDDGVHFELEEGIRVTGGMPRAIILDDGSVRIFFITNDGIGSAISTDGLLFENEAGLRFENADFGEEVTTPSIVELADGTYRAYLSDLPRPGTGPSPHHTYSAVSEDMLTWEIEDGIRVGEGSALPDSAEHPAAFINADGSTSLYYCNNQVSPQEGGPTAIFHAVAADGLSFTESETTYLNGCDPDILLMPDGTLRMFYGNFSPEIGGVLYSAAFGLAEPIDVDDLQNSGPQGPSSDQGSNPFQSLSDEEIACLESAWGGEALGEISSFSRPPTEIEMQAIPECGIEIRGPSDGGGNGPEDDTTFIDQTYYAFSDDGITWTEGKLLAEMASVPDVIYTQNGEILVYWVDFSFMTGPGLERIGIARSTDQGQSFEILGHTEFEGLGDVVPVDPEVVQLADGSFRMYFYDIANRNLAHPMYSAVSEDGFNFVMEEGTRLIMDEIYDPEIVYQPDGKIRMYVNGFDILSGVSSDGLNFTADEGVRVEMGGVPGAILLDDGTIRMYACVDGISVYESQDGLDFTEIARSVITGEPGEPSIICDPSVDAIEEGYILVYKVKPLN